MKKLNIALGLALACSLGTANAAFSPSADSSYYNLRAHFDKENYPFEMQENKYYTATMDFQREFSNIDYVCFTPTFEDSEVPHVRLYNKTEVPGYSRGDATASGQRRCSGSSGFADSFKDGKVTIEFKARDFDDHGPATLKDLIITVIGKSEIGFSSNDPDKPGRLIATCDQFIEALEYRDPYNQANLSYNIVNDLDCNGSKFLDTSGKTFGHSFKLNGNGHSISNLNVKGEIFANLRSHSTIQNIKFKNPYFEFPSREEDVHSSLFSGQISNHSLVSNITIENPSSDGGYLEEVIDSIHDSEVRNFTLIGNKLKFVGSNMFTGSVRNSIVDNVAIENVSHHLEHSSTGGLFANDLYDSKILNIDLSDIEINWVGKGTQYSFFTKSFSESNKVDNIKLKKITYPAYHYRLTMMGEEYLSDSTSTNEIKNVSHDFWSVGDYPLFPVYWNSYMYGSDLSDQSFISNVTPSDSANVTEVPLMCRPYVEADKFYSLRVEQ